jgi:multidrug efflux system outer membrane protein
VLSTNPQWLIAALLCSALTACALTGERYHRPAVPVPSDWEGERGAAAAWPEREWWKGFQSSELDRLIAGAQDGNHDLKAAAARVTQARALAQVAAAALYPDVQVTADARRGRSNPRSSPVNNYLALGEVSYGIDVWGLNRFASAAAADAVMSSVYAQQVVRLTLTTDVANSYFQILSLNDRLEDAQRNLANARKVMDLVNAQKEAGRVSSFEVERQMNQVAANEAAIPPLRQQLRAARDALAVLLGKNPEQLTISAPSLRTLAAPVVPLGLPARLLERRPDIRQAEMDLIAADANVAAARAALFPHLTAAGQLGFKSGTGLLTGAGSAAQSISLALLQTIFDGGKLRGEVKLAMGRKAELAEAYQQSVLTGLREVEDALAGVEQFTLQEKAQQEAALHAREAYRLAELQLRTGAADFTAVLDAERTLLAAETAADEARFSRFSSLIALYHALGGGWEDRAADVATS